MNFRFELFDPELKCVLSNCSYMNLPFDIPEVGPEVNYLLTKCGSFFFEEYKSEEFVEKLQECQNNAKIILDISWEKINTGHWKDVKKDWRDSYSLASLFGVLCLLLNKSVNKMEVIKACDMGLLMGTPIMQNILSKIAFKLSSIISTELDCNVLFEKEIKKFKQYECVCEDFKKVKAVEKIDPMHFKDMHVTKHTPVQISGALKNWLALSSSPWSVEYIMNKMRFRTVPVEIGSKYTDESWTQKLMTVEEFVLNYILCKTPKETGYLAQHNLFDQVPELFEDIGVPCYITENFGNVDVDISVYFGPSGTISPLHYDPKHNLLAQVIGQKYVRLYSKETTECLYPRYNTWLSNTSQVDIDNPDFESFPLFKDAPFTECILSPGDILYIPPGCWHYVRSLSVSFSISFWWDIPDNVTQNDSPQENVKSEH